MTVDAPPPELKCEFVGPKIRGMKRRQTRIVGGEPALSGSFPFAAALATDSRFQYCGGSVVADRFILTAAHCQVGAGDLALVGSTDLTKARAVRISESRINPKFVPATLDFDVAVAKLEASAGVPTVSLAATATSKDATVIGWGATSEGGSTTTLLRQVSVPLWDWEKCRGIYPSLTSRQLCAGESGVDSCQGDSGSSLLTPSTSWQQLGIVSYGIGCARPGIPGVYSDLRAPELSTWVAACIRE